MVRRNGALPCLAVAQESFANVQDFYAAGRNAGSPILKVFSVTQQHPGQNPFISAPPNPNLSGGPIYLFTQFADGETNSSGGDFPLGLSLISFQASGMSQPVTIQPSNDVAVSLLRIPGAGQAAGFAKYGPLDAANPDRRNWFRYWWSWDTSSYATNPAGPETIVLTGENYGGITVTNTLTFGPEVRDNVWVPLGGNNYTATIIGSSWFFQQRNFPGPAGPNPRCASPQRRRNSCSWRRLGWRSFGKLDRSVCN